MKSRPEGLLLFIAFLAISSCDHRIPVSGALDWPCWRGPNANGISIETGWDPAALAAGPRVLWKVDIGVGYSNVVIQEGRLYAMGLIKQGLEFQCLDAVTGKTIWRSPHEEYFPPQSTPAIDGDFVYGLGAEGTLFCLRAGDGKLLWTRDLKADFNAQRPTNHWASSPVVEGDLLLINANTAQIALAKRTGDLTWSVADEVPRSSWGSHATPVVRDISDTRCALFLGPSTLNAVEVATGKKLWSYAHEDVMHPVADPVVAGSKILVQLVYSCTLLETTGPEPKVLWSNSELDTCLPAAVLVEGYLYGTHTPYSHTTRSTWSGMSQPDWPFRCMDWKTGKVMWEKTMKHATLMAAGGKLVILEVDGTLHIAEASPASYKELSSADVLLGAKKPRTFATPPVLCHGRIYCRNYAGDLVCIDMSK